MFNLRHATAEINLQALTHNFHALKSLLKPQTKFMAVVKANAYGHGAVGVASHLQNLGADYFGVSCLYEVAELREIANITKPILNMGPTFIDDIPAIFHYGYIPTIFSLDVAQNLSNEAVKRGRKIKIHFKFDTGMNRIGANCEQTLSLINAIQKLPNIEIEGIFSHFADSESLASGVTEIQLQKFNNVLSQLSQAQIHIPIIHLAKSSGVLFWPQSHFDLVRAGLALYGISPAANAEKLPIELKPVMSIKARIAQIKQVSANTPISYGWTYLTDKPSIIATLTIGYADGFRRSPKNWGNVLLKGQLAPILGRVCMDQVIVDATEINDLNLNDEAVIIGGQGKNQITAWDAANQIGTSAYEVVSSISARVSRKYI